MGQGDCRYGRQQQQQAVDKQLDGATVARQVHGGLANQASSVVALKVAQVAVAGGGGAVGGASDCAKGVAAEAQAARAL